MKALVGGGFDFTDRAMVEAIVSTLWGAGVDQLFLTDEDGASKFAWNWIWAKLNQSNVRYWYDPDTTNLIQNPHKINDPRFQHIAFTTVSVDDGEGSAAWGNANDRMLDYAESGDLCVTFAAVDDGSDRSRATADLITKVTTANLTIHQITTADQLDDLVI